MTRIMKRLGIDTLKELSDRYGLSYAAVRSWNARLDRAPAGVAKHADEALARAARNANRAIVRERRKAAGL